MTVENVDLIPENFDDLFVSVMNHEYTEYLLGGGRGSCKSSFISICIRLLMKKNPDISCLSMRKHANGLYDSVFTQLKWADGMYGLSPRYIKTPMRMTEGDQQILFRGADDPTKIKSVKVEKGYIGILWFEEVTEFTPEEIRSIKQSVMRGGDKFWIFYSFNPPLNRNNWVNKEFLIDKPGRICHRSDYTTVPVEWLGQPFIDEAEWLREHNYRLYQNEYMGEPVGAGLDVFENLKEIELTDDEIGKMDYHFHGIDWGYYPDPWAYNGMAYKPNTRELFIYSELEELKKGNEETSRILLDYFRNGAWMWYNTRQPESPSEIAAKLVPDSAEPKSISDYREYGWHCHEPKKTGLRDYGFKWLQTLSAIYIDRKRCPKTWEEFHGYAYETDKNGEVISTYPEGQADHHIACVRYALEEIYRRKGQ